MRTAIVTLIALVGLSLGLVTTALAAPHGDQSACPNGAPTIQAHRSATGQANACGPRANTGKPASPGRSGK